MHSPGEAVALEYEIAVAKGEKTRIAPACT